MSPRLVLAVVLLAVSSPALAQEAPSADPPVVGAPDVGAPAAPERPMTPEEQAFEVLAQAFDARIETMMAEVDAVMGDAATNGADKRAAVDRIVLAQEEEIERFAQRLEAFLAAREAVETDPAVLANIQRARTAWPANARAIPGRVRAAVAAAIAEASAAADAPATPEAVPQDAPAIAQPD